MYASKFYISTLKKISNNINNISYKLMLKSGMIKNISKGIYAYMPLGLIVLKNIENIIKKEMNNINILEILTPILQPKSLWKESGRFIKMKSELMCLKDRNNKYFIMQPTCEEVISYIVRTEINSFKQLPIMFYNIQTKFRDEKRVQYGLIKTKEFIMKDAYSFDKNIHNLNKTYYMIYQAYINIFKKLNLKFKVIYANNGNMGGDLSHEFYALNCNFNDTGVIEIAHIFQLGTRYFKNITLKNKLNNIYMGCYGIGISRILSSIIEQNNDKKGILWPSNLSPFKIVICPVDLFNNKKILIISKKIYEILKKNNINVILDDRKKKIGNILNDWELIGIPHFIIIGKKYLYNNEIEYKNRKNSINKFINIKEIINFIKYIIKF